MFTRLCLLSIKRDVRIRQSYYTSSYAKHLINNEVAMIDIEFVTYLAYVYRHHPSDEVVRRTVTRFRTSVRHEYSSDEVKLPEYLLTRLLGYHFE
jgi:hypothetical protein